MPPTHDVTYARCRPPRRKTSVRRWPRRSCHSVRPIVAHERSPSRGPAPSNPRRSRVFRSRRPLPARALESDVANRPCGNRRRNHRHAPSTRQWRKGLALAARRNLEVARITLHKDFVLIENHVKNGIVVGCQARHIRAAPAASRDRPGGARPQAINSRSSGRRRSHVAPASAAVVTNALATRNAQLGYAPRLGISLVDSPRSSALNLVSRMRKDRA